MRAWVPIPAQLEDVSCAVCDGERRELLLPHDWFGFPIRLVACRDCGFVYCSPRPTAGFMERFYRRHYLLFYEGWSELTEEYIRAHELREAARDRVARYGALVPPGGRVMDVGCGAGSFLAALRSARPDVAVQGIEPGAAAARHARDALGVPVFEGPYRALPSAPSYDLVTAFHVAEHVPDLGDFFAFLRERVAPGGRVVLESPNLEGSWRDLSMFHVAHLYAFTPASLARLARRHGFAVARAHTSDAGWDWPNLHVVLQVGGAGDGAVPTPVPVSDATREKLRRAVRPRWWCVVRAWVKLALRYVGLGQALDRWRLRRARRR